VSEPARHAAILAGGASSRMGEPKAAIELLGRPLIGHAIDATRQAGLEPLVVAKRDTGLPAIDCALLLEPGEPLHPAVGVIAALERVGGPVVVLPCDAPLVPPALIAELAGRPVDFLMPVHPREQPLIARYAPALLPRLREGVDAGDSMHAIAADLGGERMGADELATFGDPERMFINANDPAEIERLRTELSEG